MNPKDYLLLLEEKYLSLGYEVEKTAQGLHVVGKYDDFIKIDFTITEEDIVFRDFLYNTPSKEDDSI